MVADMKLLKAEIMELVKFGRFEVIATTIVDSTTGKDGDGDDFIESQLKLIFSQVVQKVLRAIPQNQAKLGCPGAANLKKFVGNIAGCEQLGLSNIVAEQFASLQQVLSYDDKTVLPGYPTPSSRLLRLYKCQAQIRSCLLQSALFRKGCQFSNMQQSLQKRGLLHRLA